MDLFTQFTIIRLSFISVSVRLWLTECPVVEEVTSYCWISSWLFFLIGRQHSTVNDWDMHSNFNLHPVQGWWVRETLQDVVAELVLKTTANCILPHLQVTVGLCYLFHLNSYSFMNIFMVHGWINKIKLIRMLCTVAWCAQMIWVINKVSFEI